MYASILKRYGIKGGFLKVIFKSLSLLGIDYECSICWVYRLKEGQSFGDEEANLCIELNEDDFVNYGDKTWFSQQKLEDIRKAFSIPGNRPLGIIRNNQLICYAWLSSKFWGNDITRKLRPQDAYLWDDYVHPSFRGCGLHAVLINARLNYLQKLRKDRIFTIVSVYNQASYKGFKKIGFKKWQTFFRLKFKWSTKEVNSFRYE